MPVSGQNVGFVGLGAMGAPMAERLVGAGFSVTVFDPSAQAMARLERAGAHGAPSPAAVADRAETVVACLPDPEVSRQVAFGPGGVAEGTAARIYVETSTIGMKAMREIDERLARAGIGVVDAPVSGGPNGARAGTLSMMVAARPRDRSAAEATLSATADRIFTVAEEPGLGQVMKLANNIMTHTNLLIACEAVAMGVKAGLDAALMIDVINRSTGRNQASETKFPKSILPRSFDYGARLAIPCKDMVLAAEEARMLGVPNGISGAVLAVFREAVAEGMGEDDFTAIFRLYERKAAFPYPGKGIPAA